MDDSVLDKLVVVENEIQERLKSEKEKIKKWLEQVKNESAEEISKEEYTLKEAFNIKIRQESLNAENEASAIVKHADENALKLDSLDDETLQKTVLKHILKILPEKQS